MTCLPTLAAAALLIALPFTAAAEEASAAPSGVVIDAATERVLLDTCAFLRSAERFSVEVDVTYDEVLQSGPKVQYNRQTSLVMERPNHLRFDTIGDKGLRSFYYDGKSLTMFQPGEGVYATSEVPGTIDALIDTLEERGVELPLSDIFESQPCAGLAEHLKTGTYAGRHFSDGEWYHHLLLETDAVDVQLWIAEGDEPEIHKVVITYRDAPGAPQFSAVLSEWNFAPETDEGVFTFAPPEGVRQVAFLDADESEGGGK